MKDTKPRQLSSVPQAKEERVGVAYRSLVCFWHLTDVDADGQHVRFQE